MNMKRATKKPKPVMKVKEQAASKIRGGSSNIMKTKHDTAKNSISNVR
jgi:hypothetical protein